MSDRKPTRDDAHLIRQGHEPGVSDIMLLVGIVLLVFALIVPEEDVTLRIYKKSFNNTASVESTEAQNDRISGFFRTAAGLDDGLHARMVRATVRDFAVRISVALVGLALILTARRADPTQHAVPRRGWGFRFGWGPKLVIATAVCVWFTCKGYSAYSESKTWWSVRRATDVGRPLLLNGEVYTAGAVAITPDSRWLIAGGELQIGPSENQTPIKLWDLKSAQPASERLVSEKGFNGYVLAPNGRWLAIENRLHDLTSDDPATSPQLLSGVVRAISGDSRWLITTLAIDTSRQVVQVYDLAGQHPSTVVHRWEPKFSSISSVAVTTDSRWLVVGSDRGRRLRGNMAVQLWDLIADDPTSSTRVGRLEDRPHSRNSPSRRSDLRPSEIDFAEATMGPKGRWLATVSSAGRYSTFTKQTAVLWDLGIGKQAPRVFHEGHRNSNDGRAGPAIVFSPDGRWFVVIKDEDDEVWLFDLTAHDGKNSPLICTGEKGIDSLTITRDSRWLILHRRYGTSRLLDLAVADPTISPRSFHRLALSDDHRWMLGTGSQGETPRLWDLTVSPEPSSRELRGNLADGIRRFAISPDGRWLATGDNAVRLCDLAAKNADNQSPRQLIDGYGHIASLMFSPDNRWLIVGGYGILLWDLREIGEQPGDIARNHDVSPIQSDTER